MPGSNVMVATSLAPKILASTQLAATTPTTVYTVPAGSAAIVKHGVLCNVSAAPVSATVSVVPSGGTVDGTHRVLSAVPIAAGDSFPLDGLLTGTHLGPGDFVSVQASVAAALDVVISGVEST